MEATAPLLRLEALSKQYESPEGGPAALVLRDISLSLSAGETLAVMGPSGSGKSTLLHMMGALDRPTSGRVWLDGQDLSACGDEELSRVRSLKIGLVFQAHHLLPQCTALENVLVPTLSRHARPLRAQADKRARRLLERVGLSDRMGHRPGLLSGGERQRVAVVRALINQPMLLFADEPTGALDRGSADRLADLLCELNREEGVALVVATHAEPLAMRMSRVLRLHDGRLTPGDAPA